MTTDKPENPPAFPWQHPDYDGNWNHARHRGLTMRDYFAAAAMQAGVTGCSSRNEPIDYRECAAYSYELADAMLKQRGSI